MKFYRGTTIKEGEGYRKKGIPIGEKFTNELNEAKRFGSCIVSVNSSRNFVSLKENEDFKLVKIKTKYFKNKKLIKRFKII